MCQVPNKQYISSVVNRYFGEKLNVTWLPVYSFCICTLFLKPLITNPTNQTKNVTEEHLKTLYFQESSLQGTTEEFCRLSHTKQFRKFLTLFLFVPFSVYPMSFILSTDMREMQLVFHLMQGFLPRKYSQGCQVNKVSVFCRKGKWRSNKNPLRRAGPRGLLLKTSSCR